MINRLKFIADIAEYNAYIIEIEAETLNDANQLIFSMSKQMSHNVNYRILEVAVRPIMYSSPIFDNLNFNHVKRKSEDGLKIFNIKDIGKFSNKTFIFCYNAFIAEYNRYNVEIENSSRENALNIIRMNKSHKTSGYYPSLIQVNSKPYFEGNQNVIVLN